MNKLILPIAFLLLLSMTASTWHNDPGNDSCITFYSDKEIYYIDRLNPILEPTIKAENNCGNPITGNLGIFFQTKDLQGTTIQNIQQSTTYYTILTEETYECKQIAQFNKDTKIGTCYYDDLNGMNIIFQQEVIALKDKTFTWEQRSKINQFSTIQKTLAPSTADTGKIGFELKESTGNITIPTGKSYLKFTASLPNQPINKHGYFIVTFENDSKKTEKTILDPEFWETGEYTADADTNALWHCNESAGTTVTDAAGNFDGTASNSAIWETGTKKWGAGSCGLDASYYFYTTGSVLDDGMPPDEWTFETWFYPLQEYKNPMTHIRLWNKVNVTNQDQIFVWIDNLSRFQFAMEGNNEGILALQSAEKTWAINTWYHLMIIYDGTNWAMYIDGVRETSAGAGTQMQAGTQNDFHFGTYDGTPGIQIPNALFDEIAISDVNRFETPWSFPGPAVPDYVPKLRIDTDLNATGNVEIGGNLKVISDANFLEDVNIYKDLNIGGTTGLNDQLTLHGNARVIQTLSLSAQIAKGGGTAPTSAIIGNYPVLKFSSGGGVESAYFVGHVPDDWDSTADVDMHIHWSPTNGNAGDVVWDIDYVSINPENNEVLTAATDNLTITDSTQSLQDELLETGHLTLPAVDIMQTGVVSIKLSRDTADEADTYGADAAFILIHIEYTSNRLGTPT